MFVKPVEGRMIRDPVSFVPVPPEGREVTETDYWLLAVRDGDLQLVEPPPLRPNPI